MPIEDYRMSFPVPPEAYAGVGSDDPDGATTRRRLLVLMKDLDGTHLTAERLGWLNLWTRSWNALDCVHGSTNPLVLHSAQRAAQELHVQTQLILHPIHSFRALSRKFGSDTDVPPHLWEQVLTRLRGSAAWTLFNDRAKWLKTGSKLGEMYDPKPARDLRQDPQSAALHEALVGSIPMASDQELRNRKEVARKRVTEEVNRVNDWLASPGFEPWSSSAGTSAYEPPSLGWFLGEDIKSYGDQLRAVDQSLLRLQHSVSSSVLHGSSAEELGQLIGDQLFPAIRAFPDEVESITESVVGDVNVVWLSLMALRPRCWSGV